MLAGWIVRRLTKAWPSVEHGEEAAVPYALLQTPYDNRTVSLEDLLRASTMRSPFIEPDRSRRRVGAHYYPLIREVFFANHKSAQVVVQDGAGLAVCLYSKDDEEFADELEILVLRNTIRYEWSSARLLQAELNELDESACRWLRPKECRNIRLGVFSLITQVQTSIGRENKRHALSVTDADPTERLTGDLDFLRPLVAREKLLLEEEAERAAQVVYATGMAAGTAVLGLLAAALGAIFIWRHIPAVNGVGALAGGLGACLSVLQRLTSGRLKLDYRSDRRMLTIFGAVRPFVGAVFGTITYCVIQSGLLPDPVQVPKDKGPLLAFVAFFAFFAAFNERFFQDMLRSASGGVGGSDQTETGTPVPAA